MGDAADAAELRADGPGLGRGAGRRAAPRRNLHLAPKTTLQSAIGVRHPRIAQTAHGAMGGSFNTGEFFHGRSRAFVHRLRGAAALLGFAQPVLALAAAGHPLAPAALGLLAERWSFFSEARHPQNLYYQTVG